MSGGEALSGVEALSGGEGEGRKAKGAEAEVGALGKANLRLTVGVHLLMNCLRTVISGGARSPLGAFCK